MVAVSSKRIEGVKPWTSGIRFRSFKRCSILKTDRRGETVEGIGREIRESLLQYPQNGSKG